MASDVFGVPFFDPHAAQVRPPSHRVRELGLLAGNQGVANEGQKHERLAAAHGFDNVQPFGVDVHPLAAVLFVHDPAADITRLVDDGRSAVGDHLEQFALRRRPVIGKFGYPRFAAGSKDSPGGAPPAS